ncbi:hypothetical protein Tco_1105927 [Tanacetum coccineum]
MLVPQTNAQEYVNIDHPLNDRTSSSSSDTKISYLPTSLFDKALTISRTYDVTDALDSPERPGPIDWQNLMSGQLATSTWNSLDEHRLFKRLGPLDWDNLMSRQLTTGTSNSLDEQRGVLPLQSTGHCRVLFTEDGSEITKDEKAIGESSAPKKPIIIRIPKRKQPDPKTPILTAEQIDITNLGKASQVSIATAKSIEDNEAQQAIKRVDEHLMDEDIEKLVE